MTKRPVRGLHAHHKPPTLPTLGPAMWASNSGDAPPTIAHLSIWERYLV